MASSAPVPAKPAIQSDRQAGIEAQTYIDLGARITQLDAAEQAKIAKIKQTYESQRAPLVARREECFVNVQAWAEATRADRKTIKFPNGREFRWRIASGSKVIVGGTLESIISQLLKRRDWKKFLKVELRKSSLAAHPKVIEQIEGLRLERGEYASIK